MAALSKFKVLFLVGPTASGKSELALRLAQENQGAIINCDSIQVYQGLEIGSAKPSQQERNLAPHFLFDYVPVGNELTVGEYSRDFFKTLEQVSRNFSWAIVVGGTGFYFQALEKGLFTIGAADPEILLQVEKEISEDAAKVYSQLQACDPLSAEKIHPSDHYRLARAIEIFRTHGKSKSAVEAEFQQAKKDFPFPLYKIGLWAERADLEKRVQLRSEQMPKKGLIKETEDLIKQYPGLEQSWSPLSSVGYKEVVEYLKPDRSVANLQELAANITMSTLRLAKKQRTWFRRDQQIRWFGLDPAETKSIDLKALCGPI